MGDLSAASEQDLIERGAQLVEMAIRDHLIADVRVGLNVSGGVDSSVLVNVAKTAIGARNIGQKPTQMAIPSASVISPRYIGLRVKR